MSAAGITITVIRPPAAQIIGGHSSALATKATLGTALIVQVWSLFVSKLSYNFRREKLKQLKLIYGRFQPHNQWIQVQIVNAPSLGQVYSFFY